MKLVMGKDGKMYELKDGQESEFAERDGDMTNIEAGLHDAAFFAKDEKVLEEEDYDSKEGDETEADDEEIQEGEGEGEFADRDGDLTDIQATLRDAKYVKGEEKALEEEEDDEDASKEEDDTTAGDDKIKDGEGEGEFADRDGDATDIKATLRDAKYTPQSHTIIVKDVFEPEEERVYERPSDTPSPTFISPPSPFQPSPPPSPPETPIIPPAPPTPPPFSYNIKILDINTLQVAQISGSEDVGRSAGNTSKVSAIASDIDQETQGLSLEATTVTQQVGSPAGNYGLILSAIPDGASILYNGILFSKDTASSSGLTISDSGSDSNGGSGWNVEIANFDNNANFKFIPPHNSDKEYQLDAKAFVIDGNDKYITQPLQIDVNVVGVADIPVNDDLGSVTVTDDAAGVNTFNLKATEDSTVNLKNILATPDTISSYDNDGSETLTIRLTGLAADFNVTGTGVTLLSGSGTGRKWLIEVDDIVADNVSITTPSHYAGEIDFKIQMITTEQEGDSKTHTEKDVTVMITPVVDNTIKTSDIQNEDESLVIDFGLNNVDSGNASKGEETVQTFQIDVTGLDAAGITLTTAGGVDLTTGKTGFQSIVVNAGTLEAVTAVLTEDSHMNGSYNFDIKYTIDDVATDVAANIYTDTKTVTSTYTIVVNAVTDDITLSATTNHADANTSGANDVTATDNGIFTKVLTVVGLDTDARGNVETDGSEQFTRVTVSGVPEGITITDGVYAGNTGGGNYSGFWFVDIPNQALDGSTNYNLEFDMDGSFVNGITYPIVITAFNEDFGTSTDNLNGIEQSDSITFDLIISGNIVGPGPGIPATITSFYQDIDNDSIHDHVYEVTTSADTNITDADAYQGSVLREDTQFNLSDVVHVETDDTGATSTQFSITLKNVPVGVVIEGMTKVNIGGVDVYTLSGNGDQQVIVTALNAIKITPVSDGNTDGTDGTSIANTDLAFDVELTTYATGGANNTALINFSGSILPVTDEMTLTVVNDGTTTEDTTQAFSIKLDNSADGVKTSIVDGKVYLKLTENYTDSNDGTDGTVGVFKEAGNVITATSVTGVTGITDGMYYVLTGRSYDEIINFTYAPAEDRNGSVTITSFVKNSENEAWTTYDTTELVSSQTFSFNVTAVQDGFTFDGVQEVFTATFGATVDADTVTFDGLGALTLTAGNTAIESATEYVTYYNAQGGATWIAVDNGDGTVTFTAKIAGVRADIIDGDFVIGDGGVGADTIVTVATPSTQGYAVSGTGIEDNLAQVHVTLSNPDSSEQLSSFLLDKIPDGFLVYSGATEASAQLALNTGENGTTDVVLTYGQPADTVTSNLWSIALINGEIPAYIGIKAPAHWSGTIEDIVFSAIDNNGNTSLSAAIDVVVTPVVDTLTVNATQTFGYSNADVALKINANVKDLDASETVTLTLVGLGNDTTFKVDGVDKSGDVSYDGGTDTYTITGIEATKINNVTFDKASDMDGSVTLTAKMLESDATESALATGTSSFNVELVSASATPTTGDDTLLENGGAQDGLAGIDTVMFTSAGNIVYANLSNIEVLDLNAGNQTLDGSGTITGLTLAEVVQMTDTNNDLTIIGDSGDTVQFANADGWSTSSTVTESGHTFDVYTNSGDASVSVKVEENIADSIL